MNGLIVHIQNVDKYDCDESINGSQAGYPQTHFEQLRMLDFYQSLAPNLNIL